MNLSHLLPSKYTPSTVRLILCTFIVALASCGGGGGSGDESSATSPQAQVATATVRLSATIDFGTAARINEINTASGATVVTLGAGGAATVAISSESPLLLATDRQGGLVLASLGADAELSETSTAIALLWLWMKPVLGNSLDDRTFPSKATSAKSFDILIGAVRAALHAGTGPASAPAVLTALNQVAAEVGPEATIQMSRMRPLAAIATPRLQGSIAMVRTEDLVIGNIFVNATDNISIFNGTALYWSSYAQSYAGVRVDKPDLLKPVTVLDAYRYGRGAQPNSEFKHIQGHPSVAYNLNVMQDEASRRANSVMIVRSAMGTLLGTAALAFGESVECLNEFIAAVAPAELDAVAAGGGSAAIETYLTAYRRAVAEASLTALTLSAPCTGGATLLSRLTRLMPFIQAGLRIYNDAFARVGDASKVRDAVQTWLGVADQVALTLHKSYVVGVCVTGGVVKPCPDRYEIAEPYPWLEGARGKLALTAFSRNEQTFVPSTLTISSPNLFPSAVAPDTVVQVLRAGETTLHLQDVPTGHDTSTVTMRVEPGQIRYVSFLGSATNGPLRINEGRMIAVVANSNVTQFQGDVDFTWSVAPGSESIVELIAGGQRSAAVKGLRSGAATIYAVNTVTRRTLEFVVQVEPTITEVVDWTSSTTGKLGSISISISTIGTPPLSNPSLFGGPLVSRIFSSGHFDGPVSLVKSIEVYGKSQQVTNTYTVTFSAPVTDVRVHLGSLASVVTFNQPVTRISGQPSFSVTGSTVTGVVDNSGSITDSNGTIGLSGTFSSFSFTTVGLPNVGLADGIAIQIAARGI